jgi:hypothetical protein
MSMRSAPGAAAAITNPYTCRISCVRCRGSDVTCLDYSEHRDEILPSCRAHFHTPAEMYLRANRSHLIAGKLD